MNSQAREGSFVVVVRHELFRECSFLGYMLVVVRQTRRRNVQDAGHCESKKRATKMERAKERGRTY